MPVAEKKQLTLLIQEVRALKARIDQLVPLDAEGEYKPSFLKKLDRSRKSQDRFAFKNGFFTRLR